jgi:hypothetical protein
MTTDFNEENAPSRTLATCHMHGLKYDPQLTWGCVLCRKNQTKRISGYLVAGVILISAALLFLFNEMTSSNNQHSKIPIFNHFKEAHNGADAQDVQPVIVAPQARKNSSVFASVEACLLETVKDSDDSIIDKELCLNKLSLIIPDTDSPAGTNCLYCQGNAPKWTDIRSAIEKEQHRIEKCVQSARYNFVVKISVSDKKTSPDDIIVSTSNLNASQALCVGHFLSELTYPQAESRYSIVAFLNSDVISQNRIDQAAERRAEFERFRNEQRENEQNSERHDALIKDRIERNNRAREEIINSR